MIDVVGNPPPDTDTVGADVKLLPTIGVAIAVITPFVKVHVVVAYPPPPDITIVGGEEKQLPAYPPLVMVKLLIAAPVKLTVIFITPPPLYDTIG